MSIIRDGLQSADLDVLITSPTLNLDFANSQVLDPRITFSRGSIGTRVNRNGLIEVVPANQPRFDYDPISGECKGLLIEESRTNLVLNSTTLSSHTNSATTTVLTTETTSPDGTFNSYKIIGNSGVRTRESIYTNSFTMNANSSYTASVFLKGTATRRYAVMWFDNTPPGNSPVEGPYYGASVFIDLLTGTSTNSSVVKMIPYGNGWYRCHITATVGASDLTNVFFNVSIGSPNGFNDIGNPNQYKYIGDGISGFYYWAPQVEVSSFPTSYIPTSASTVTRSTDILDILGSNFTNFFGNTSPNELSVFYSGLSPYTFFNGINLNSPFYWVLTNDNITERIDFRYAGLPQVIPILNGVAAGGGVFPNASQINDIKSVALIDSKSFAIILNDGSQNYDFTRSTRLSRMPFGFTRLRIGSGATGGRPLNGTIRKLTVYPKRLSFSQATYLTQ